MSVFYFLMGRQKDQEFKTRLGYTTLHLEKIKAKEKCVRACCFAGNHGGKRLHTDSTPAAPRGCLVCEGVCQMLPASRYQYLCAPVPFPDCSLQLRAAAFLDASFSLQRRDDPPPCAFRPQYFCCHCFCVLKVTAEGFPEW